MVSGHISFPTWEEYAVLDMETKIKLLVEADTVTIGLRQKLYSQGTCWMMFCGSWETPVHTTENFEDIPSDEQIMQMAQELGFAPLCFSHGPSLSICPH